jgi:ribosomal protein S12 methylthiotransferase accessory factor YcaO
VIGVHRTERYVALVDMVRRCGARTYRIEHTVEENGPVIWVAVAETRWEKRPVVFGAGLDPVRATYALAAELVDGGTCAHCARISGIEALDADVDTEPFSGPVPICWYRFDPELRTYRRECEGD